VTAHLKY